VAVIGGLAAWYGWSPHRRLRQRVIRLRQARDLFHLRREHLEARFVSLASRSGIPRGLEWSDVDFQDSVRFARERGTGNLRALVGVTVRFRAIEGGGMEDVDMVERSRAATAVFLYDTDAWTTTGRVLFNVNPEQAIQRFGHELETVDES